LARTRSTVAPSVSKPTRVQIDLHHRWLLGQQLARVGIPNAYGDGVTLAQAHLGGEAQRLLDDVSIDHFLPRLRDGLALRHDVDLDATGAAEQVDALGLQPYLEDGVADLRATD
jgi:hypothetical protein